MSSGFFGFPHTTHYFLEVIWKDLIKRNKSFGKYLPDVIVENLHPDFNKGSIDKTYQEAASVKNKDEEIWLEWRENNFDKFYQAVNGILQ